MPLIATVGLVAVLALLPTAAVGEGTTQDTAAIVAAVGVVLGDDSDLDRVDYRVEVHPI